MKIIEKKCPNCGAGLSFGDTDKSCKCEYCHREFEIEREEDDTYNLIDPKSMEKVAKVGITVVAASFLIPIVIFIIAMVGFVVILLSTSKNDFNSNSHPIKTVEPVPENKMISDVNQMKKTDLARLKSIASEVYRVMGRNDSKCSFQKDDEEVYKYIVAYKDDTNYVYIVDKVIYIHFFNQKERTMAIIPIRYENIKNMDEEEFESMKVDAPKYFLNKDKSTYIRGGYANYNDFYKNKIDHLKKNGYKITIK